MAKKKVSKKKTVKKVAVKKTAEEKALEKQAREFEKRMKKEMKEREKAEKPVVDFIKAFEKLCKKHDVTAVLGFEHNKANMFAHYVTDDAKTLVLKGLVKILEERV